MISNNVYLKYETLNDEESVLDFIKGEKDIISNSKTWLEDINKLMRYKKEHLRNYSSENQYRNIHGYYLKIMIPHEMYSREAEYVKSIMLEIDKRFLRDLYVFRTVREGKGYYAEIICFTRYVLKRPTNRVKRYNRDFYYSSKTGRMCKKDHPDAVLKGKKGEPVLDKEGKKIRSLVELKATEDRIFVYKTIQGLTNRLKNAVARVITALKNSEIIIKIVSRITVNEDECENIRRYKQKRNHVIRKINNYIVHFTESMILGQLADRDELKVINESLCDIANRMLHDENKKFDDVLEALKLFWSKQFLVGMM